MFSFKRKKVAVNPPCAAVCISFDVNYGNLIDLLKDKHIVSIENLNENWSSYNHVILKSNFICFFTANGMFVSTCQGVYKGFNFVNQLPGRYSKQSELTSSFVASEENNVVVLRVAQKALIGFPVAHVLNLLHGNILVEYDSLLDDFWGASKITELIVDSIDRIEKLPLKETLARETFSYENSLARVSCYSLRSSEFESFQFNNTWR